ncbi:MAG: hypothetical protein K0U45_01090 [Alphaproteobacteria bacterium]|nr:hypothetical protein [Alphaproteobacteria bacterium]
MNNGEKLALEIVALSKSATWEYAKLEWGLQSIYYAEEPDTCLCRHYPILEICELYNYSNGNIAIVGNVCVKKFLKLDSDKYFQSIRRVKKDNTKSFNDEMIKYAHGKGWISAWQRGFYADIHRKRKLSDKQAFQKHKINKIILMKINKNRNNY